MSRIKMTGVALLTLGVVAVGAGVLARQEPGRRGPGEGQRAEGKTPVDAANLAKRDQEAIQGTWQVVFAQDNGRPVPKKATNGKQTSDLKVLITRDTITFKIGDEAHVKGSYKLDPTKEPKWFDLMEQGAWPVPGIYALQGDELKICYNEAGTERPNKFASEPHSPNDVLLVLKRETPVAQIERSPVRQYEELIREYKDFSKSLQESLDQLKTEEERQAQFRKHWPLPNRFTGRFLDLARAHPDDPAAFDALAWVVAFGFSSAESDTAAELLARDHARDARLWPLCQEMARGPISLARGVLLRAILEHNPDRVLRGRAGFALAAHLKDETSFVQLSRSGLSPWHAQFLAPERLEKFRAQDPAKLTREAEALLELVLREYSDIRPVELTRAPNHDWDARTFDKQPQDTEVADRTLGDLARPLLDELRRLDVGQPAPEIEGEDADGKAFKLSDYRSKVVVLTFSGNWCGPCRAMYPHERELVKRYAGRPFALLSVNTDEEKETLLESIKTGEITWRCWWEPGGKRGAIPDRWDVQGWPKVYILDHKGVIRNKFVGVIGTEKSGPGLERAIDPLLAEVEPGEATPR